MKQSPSQNQSDLVFIHKLEFLLQSAVLRMDDELIGWITKFVECFASNLGANLTGVHQIFERDDGRFPQARLDSN